MKLYIGCALTWAMPGPEPEEFTTFRTEVRELIQHLKKTGTYDILEFVGLSGGRSPAECRNVYQYDVHQCVGQCDVFLAICDWPSLGLGYELSTAVEKRGIPTLAVARRDVNVTRLVLGIDHPEYRFRSYDVLKRDIPLFLTDVAQGR